MTNKYRVEIGYRKFTFDDRNEAIDFAETAFNSADDRNEGVSIDLVRVQEEQEDEGDE